MKPLAKYDMEELAARQLSLVPRGGVLFARTTDREEKARARQRIVDLFTPERWNRPLHMLTMPGLEWRFERKLLGLREVGWMRRPKSRGTWFTSVENDRSIYFSSITQMPGLETPDALIKHIKPFSFAERGVKTRYAAFFFADVDDLMKHKWGDNGWDAAWLDFTGPVCIPRLKLIKHFFERHVRSTLIVTALKARWDQKTSEIIDSIGYARWLCQHLDGEILHYIEYYDTSPIVQLAIRH